MKTIQMNFEDQDYVLIELMAERYDQTAHDYALEALKGSVCTDLSFPYHEVKNIKEFMGREIV